MFMFSVPAVSTKDLLVWSGMVSQAQHISLWGQSDLLECIDVVQGTLVSTLTLARARFSMKVGQHVLAVLSEPAEVIDFLNV